MCGYIFVMISAFLLKRNYYVRTFFATFFFPIALQTQSTLLCVLECFERLFIHNLNLLSVHAITTQTYAQDNLQFVHLHLSYIHYLLETFLCRTYFFSNKI